MTTRRRARPRRRERKSIPSGRAYVTSTFNNTIVTLTDPQGNVIAWGSSGTAGFKGSRKGTPYAAQLAAHDAARKAMEGRSIRKRTGKRQRSSDPFTPEFGAVYYKYYRYESDSPRWVSSSQEETGIR